MVLHIQNIPTAAPFRSYCVHYAIAWQFAGVRCKHHTSAKLTMLMNVAIALILDRTATWVIKLNLSRAL